MGASAVSTIEEVELLAEKFLAVPHSECNIVWTKAGPVVQKRNYFQRADPKLSPFYAKARGEHYVVSELLAVMKSNSMHLIHNDNIFAQWFELIGPGNLKVAHPVSEYEDHSKEYRHGERDVLHSPDEWRAYNSLHAGKEGTVLHLVTIADMKHAQPRKDRPSLSFGLHIPFYPGRPV